MSGFGGGFGGFGGSGFGGGFSQGGYENAAPNTPGYGLTEGKSGITPETGNKKKNNGYKEALMPVNTVVFSKAAKKKGSNDTQLTIHGRDVNLMNLVGMIEKAEKHNIIYSWLINDGHGRVQAKLFSSTAPADWEAEKYAKLKEHVYVRVIGTFSSDNKGPYLSIKQIKAIEDFNDIALHEFEVANIYVKCMGPNLKRKRESTYSNADSYGAGTPFAEKAAEEEVDLSMYEDLNDPTQRKLVAFIKKSNRANGVTKAEIVKALQLTVNAVEEALCELSDNAIVFEPVDGYYSCLDD